LSLITPGLDSERDLRDALASFATGVTIITADTADGPMGITANSFTAVSLDPPLVLWCPAKSSSRFRHFVEPAHFAVHVLSAAQRETCGLFAKGNQGFAGTTPARNPENVPVLDGVLARFDCALWNSIDAGDHAVVIGRVLRAYRHDGAPLIFAQGGYGRFTAES